MEKINSWKGPIKENKFLKSSTKKILITSLFNIENEEYEHNENNDFILVLSDDDKKNDAVSR